MHYYTALLAAFAVLSMTVTAYPEARFWSGDIQDCNKTAWNEVEQLSASTPRNMDVNIFPWSDTCIRDQPVEGDDPGPRTSVWVPRIDQPFILVMSEHNDCPRRLGTDYMLGTPIKIAPDRKSLCSFDGAGMRHPLAVVWNYLLIQTTAWPRCISLPPSSKGWQSFTFYVRYVPRSLHDQ